MVDSNKLDRWWGALWGMFVGDALAMPVHWYYDVAALQRDFGVVRDFQSPRDFHPSSIMSLASTGGAGRGSQEGEVVGSIILHGKKHLWGRPNRHYHEGLQSGDNTLNLLCVRVLLRSMNRIGGYDSSDFLREYIAFMTTPDSHRDTGQSGSAWRDRSDRALRGGTAWGGMVEAVAVHHRGTLLHVPGSDLVGGHSAGHLRDFDRDAA